MFKQNNDLYDVTYKQNKNELPAIQLLPYMGKPLVPPHEKVIFLPLLVIHSEMGFVGFCHKL